MVGFRLPQGLSTIARCRGRIAGSILARQVLSSEQEVGLLLGIFRRRANVGHPRAEKLEHAPNYDHAEVLTRFDNSETIL